MILKSRKLATLFAGTASVVLLQMTGSHWNGSNLGGLTPAAIALETSLSYSPPQDLDAPKASRGTGSRGCNEAVTEAAPLSLTLLVPDDHTGLTASGHPTFSWHLSEAPEVAVEFSLVEPGVAQPLLTKTLDDVKAGVGSVTLPEELPQLEAGKKYRWSVTVICNENRRSSDIFAQAWIQRAERTEAVEAEVTPQMSAGDRAEVYAKAGLWYDALAAISEAYRADPENEAIAARRQSLLEQVGLNQVAEATISTSSTPAE
jgi:hypothetical protein